MSALLNRRQIRTFHNVADAYRAPGDPVADLLAPVERELRHEGPGAIRRVELLLTVLDWRSVFSRHLRPFWRLPREARAQVLGGRLLAGPLADLRARMDRAREAQRAPTPRDEKR